jgi:hypothetical protein
MVQRVRKGWSMRRVARAWHVSLLTVQRWVARAAGQRLDRVDWSDHPPIPQHTCRTPRVVEDLILILRTELKQHSVLGEFGAPAIQRALQKRRLPSVPSVTTISRILERRGALDGQRRVRRPPPPRGWYLPEVAAGRAELDSFDIVEGLVIQGGLPVEVLTGISLLGGLPVAWPGPPVTARLVVDRLTEHWRAVGRPVFAQFDNDTCFQGAHQHPDSISRVMRLCLSLAIVPVFTPVREPAFQAALENFNGLWQDKVWRRFRFTGYRDLRAQSAAYVRARRHRAAARIDAAPRRRPFPAGWLLDLQAPPRGRMIFLRRTTADGTAALLGRRFSVDPHWSHRLVRCDVDLDRHWIRFYALRRRAPADQPLLREVSYRVPLRPFNE